MNNRVTVNLKPGTQLFHSMSVKEVRCTKISDDVQYINDTNDSWASRLDAKQKKFRLRSNIHIKLRWTHTIYTKFIANQNQSFIINFLKHIMLFEVFIALKFAHTKKIETIKLRRNEKIYNWFIKIWLRFIVFMWVRTCAYVRMWISFAWFSDNKKTLIQEVLRDILSDKVSWSCKKISTRSIRMRLN